MLQRSPYRPSLKPFHRPVLALLRGLGLSRLAEKWIRVSNPDHAWPLRGLMAGHVMRLRSRDDFQYLAPNYEPRVCAAIQKIVRPGFVCVDVGAHIGYMTLLMAKLSGEGGRVFSFEALPENAQLLEQNVALNGWENRVDVENRAVINRSQTELPLYFGRTSFESSVKGEDKPPDVVVPATSLDDYFAYRARLDFVKMDIEGAETLAIPGMQKILERTRPVVLLEVHKDAWSAVTQLQNARYKLHDLDFNLVTIETMQSQRMNHCVAIPAEQC